MVSLLWPRIAHKTTMMSLSWLAIVSVLWLAVVSCLLWLATVSLP